LSGSAREQYQGTARFRRVLGAVERAVGIDGDGAFKKDGTLGAGELKEGEAWLSENSSNWHIVSSDEDVKEIFESMVTA
jgi:hypothetical protein